MTTAASTTAVVTVTVDGIGAVPVTVTDQGGGRPFLLLHGGAGPQSVAGFADLLGTREPARVLVFASPAGFEHFALELGEPARDDTPPAGLSVPGPEVLGPVAERYGIEVVGPPARAR